MTLLPAWTWTRKRERSRSRFHVACLLPAGLAVLAGCASHYGPGLTELSAERGWQPLPIASWVLNDGIEARAMSFCPRDTCARQGFAALIALEGREADALEKTLRSDPANLARSFAQRPARKDPRKSTGPVKPSPPKSATTVQRFSEDGVDGLLVEIRALDAGGKRAVAAILSGREAGALIVALAVSPDPEIARRDAAAAWRSR